MEKEGHEPIEECATDRIPTLYLDLASGRCVSFVFVGLLPLHGTRVPTNQAATTEDCRAYDQWKKCRSGVAGVPR